MLAIFNFECPQKNTNYLINIIIILIKLFIFLIMIFKYLTIFQKKNIINFIYFIEISKKDITGYFMLLNLNL
jgi:hypothetical protein